MCNKNYIKLFIIYSNLYICRFSIKPVAAIPFQGQDTKLHKATAKGFAPSLVPTVSARALRVSVKIRPRSRFC